MLDSDVVPPPHYIKRALRHFRHDSKLRIVAAPCISERMSLFEKINIARCPYPAGYVEIGPAGAWLMHPKVKEEVGYFDEELGYPHSQWEQTEYSARLRGKGYRIIVDCTISCRHIAKDSSSDSESVFRIIKESVKQYLVFMPHLWHKMIKARPRYYGIITLLHILVLLASLAIPFNPTFIIFPLVMYAIYFLTCRYPVGLRYKALSALGVMYQRTLVSIGWLYYIIRSLVS